LQSVADEDDDTDISNNLTCLFLDMDDDDRDFIAEVLSILQTTSNPQCPRSFSAALKESVHQGKWIAAFCKHLDSCYALGTYGFTCCCCFEAGPQEGRDALLRFDD
jgi:hypothetical protein